MPIYLVHPLIGTLNMGEEHGWLTSAYLRVEVPFGVSFVSVDAILM